MTKPANPDGARERAIEVLKGCGYPDLFVGLMVEALEEAGLQITWKDPPDGD